MWYQGKSHYLLRDGYSTKSSQAAVMRETTSRPCAFAAQRHVQEKDGPEGYSLAHCPSVPLVLVAWWLKHSKVHRYLSLSFQFEHVFVLLQ